jgi:hypothetical protein
MSFRRTFRGKRTYTGLKMRTWAIASTLALVALGVLTTAGQPTQPPHIGRCHAKVDKPQVSPNGQDSSSNKGGNNRSITTGVTLNCK